MNTEIQKIYCIHLKNSTRKAYFNDLYSCEVIDAVDSRKNPDICRDYGLTINPLTDSFKLLFNVAPGAVGCFLSHYSIWEKMVKENISYALILEDDVDYTTVNKFLNLGFYDYKKYDLVQLTKRYHYCTSEGKVRLSKELMDGDYIEFNGAESFILSIDGARKLIKATHNADLLKNISYHDFLNVENFFRKHKLKKLYPTYLPMSIMAPVDKHMVLCCHLNAADEIRLNFLHFPYIGLNSNRSRESQINISTPAWLMSENQLEKYFKI